MESSVSEPFTRLLTVNNKLAKLITQILFCHTQQAHHFLFVDLLSRGSLVFILYKEIRIRIITEKKKFWVGEEYTDV